MEQGKRIEQINILNWESAEGAIARLLAYFLRKTGLISKTNVRRDSDGLANVDDFFDSEDETYVEPRQEGHAFEEGYELDGEFPFLKMYLRLSQRPRK